MLDIHLLINASLETIYMVLVSGAIGIFFGLPLGVILLITQKHKICQNKMINRGLALLVNIVRAVPFIILLVAIVPFTRLIAGSSIGVNAAIVPLALSAIPFFARLVESALQEIPENLVETGIALGASNLQIIFKIYLPEAFPGIINCVTITLIALVGYSAMAGAVGGGGLGSVAINYGYQRFEPLVMLATVVILVFLVYIIQIAGELAAKKFRH
jgi:D-methionine transport system permease protein